MIAKLVAVAAALFGLSLIAKHHTAQLAAAKQTPQVMTPPVFGSESIIQTTLPASPLPQNDPVPEASLMWIQPSITDVPYQPAIAMQPTPAILPIYRLGQVGIAQPLPGPGYDATLLPGQRFMETV